MKVEPKKGDRIVYFFKGLENYGKRFYEAEILECLPRECYSIIITQCRRHPERVGQRRKIELDEITLCSINGKEVEKEYIPETTNERDITALMRVAYEIVDEEWFEQLKKHKNEMVESKEDI